MRNCIYSDDDGNFSYNFMGRILIIWLLLLTSNNLLGQDQSSLIRKWKLVKYDAFEIVKKSEAYIFGTDEEIQKYDETVKLLLDSVTYDFRSDGLMVYTDMENQKLIKREANWTVADSILFISEIKRPFKREAKIISLTSSTLIISPVIEGKVSESKMTFRIVE
jgi:hypothetical protein